MILSIKSWRTKKKLWKLVTNILTRIADWKITCVYTYVFLVIKNRGPGLYNSLCHTDNRKCFFGLSLMKNWREAHMFYLVREVGKICRGSLKGKFIIMNSSMVKPEKFDHFHLVYHFTVPLRINFLQSFANIYNWNFFNAVILWNLRNLL